MNNRQIMQQWPDLEPGQKVKVIADDHTHARCGVCVYVSANDTIFGRAAIFRRLDTAEEFYVFSSAEVTVVK